MGIVPRPGGVGVGVCIRALQKSGRRFGKQFMLSPRECPIRKYGEVAVPNLKPPPKEEKSKFGISLGIIESPGEDTTP